MLRATLTALALTACVLFQAGEARGQVTCLDGETALGSWEGEFPDTQSTLLLGDQAAEYRNAVMWLTGFDIGPAASVLILEVPGAHAARALFFDRDGCLYGWQEPPVMLLERIMDLIPGAPA